MDQGEHTLFGVQIASDGTVSVGGQEAEDQYQFGEWLR